MPKLETVNDNMYQKTNTGADFNRPLGVLKDTLVIVSAAQEISRLIPTGFKYLMGTHELEVYINGAYARRNESINTITYGEYSEYTNFSILFNSGVIVQGDLIRFRVTTANYKIVNLSGAGGIDPTTIANLQADVAALQALSVSNTNNIEQVGRDAFGTSYLFSASSGGSARTIGTFSDADATPDVRPYRVWKTHLGPVAPITITNFDNGRSEDIRVILFTDNQTTIQNNANIILAGNADITPSTGRTLTIFYDGSVWREVSPPGLVRKVTAYIDAGVSWTASGNYYYADVDITQLGSDYVNVTCFYHNGTINQLLPYNVERTDINTVRIWMPVNTVYVRVVVSG